MIELDEENTTPWFIDVFLNKPKALQTFLKSKGIGSREIYPPIHTQKIYNKKGSYPMSEKYCSQGLWLPSSVNLSLTNIKFITQIINEFFKKYE
jgi:perosamine synthetase